MYLIPQFRAGRRASGASPITINQTVTGGAGVTFTGVSAGELLIVIGTGTSAITTPSGFTVAIYSERSAGNSVSALYYKTASGSEGAITITGATVSAGYRLSHGTISANGNVAATVTSIAAGSTALDPVGGSVMFAAVGLQGNTTTPAASNSFGLTNSGARGIIAVREYVSGASAQNCTLSWTAARHAGAFLALVSP